MKKLVLISSRFPFPIEKGDKLRLYYQIKSLSKSFELYLLSTTDIEIDPKHQSELNRYCKEIHLFKINGKTNALKAFWTGDAFQQAYFYDRKIHKKMQLLIDKIKPDYLYYQLVRTIKYAFDFPASKTIDIMDCFSKGYSLRSNAESGLKSFFFNLEAKRLVKAENQVSKYIDRQIVISDQDASSFKNDVQYHVVGNGIDMDYFNREDHIKKKNDVLFVGNMGYEPNIYAVEYLYHKVLPLVLKRRPGTKFLIAGARPDSRVKKLNSEHFVIGGWFEDIRLAYNESRVFVAPIFDGIGQQNKVLEAISMKMPCVISPSVANGLDIDAIESMLMIEGDAMGFADQIVNILNQAKMYDDKVIKAYKYLKANRSWEAVNQKLVEIIKR